MDRAILTGLRAATAAARGVAAGGRPASRHPPPGVEGPLRVLMLAHYPASNAGTRHRLAHWAERLRRAGHSVDLVLPTAPGRGETLFRRWSGRDRAEYHLRLLAGRLRAIRRSAEFDVVVIHLNDLPHWEYGQPWVARELARRAGRVLLDLDDLPVFGGATETGPRARALASAVDGLIVGNPELREHFPAAEAWDVPTCVEPAGVPAPDRSGRPGPAVLGWMGTSGNLGPLERLAPVLAEVCAEGRARVRVVCDRPPELPGVPVDFVPWSVEAETRELAAMDVGLAPLDDGPMERCKCGLKCLLAMAAGLPVVASPVGVLGRMVRPETGLLARDPSEWAAALGRLAADPALRRALGTAGREAAQRDWSYARHEANFVRALRRDVASCR